ncbi:BolA family protein [Thiomicrospira cyclica]|uniref:BolA family protein n=1 Tax=Thiomicrospira cyclica (strain DSM 14477 / JCM 11371 / ALM1) TaxID=717773 RepID=F6D9B2_THICA|nr:BolA family protein [Thiomicrospira cyclica ALM1]
MSIAQQIEMKIKQNLPIYDMALQNDSHLHAGPATESHFKLVLVSDAFSGLSRVKRHQTVYQALGDLMTQFHALALHTYTPDEWQARQTQVPNSTPCAHG